ncbi:olfactory receptor 6F1-like isoform X4 [Cyanistes caeruleus]|uniref:olfactory receptor 6F1-like isoform X4 n=1 Tax=Cyanistes caeruleus TaxID=156563 RepID=UPI000CDAD41C|nr:olfactory receptor 6F1-like isoform X4 [Cyanistes caeruleus]
MERKQGQAVAISLNQGDHGYLGRTVHEKMSFGSFQLANLEQFSRATFNGIQLRGFCLQSLRLNISAQVEMSNIQTYLSIWKDMVNGTSVEEFILLGFPGTRQFRVSFVVVFALMYTLTVIGNASVIALVWRSSNLHTPMYFFLCNLSFLEIWYTTGVVPKAIGVMLGTSQTISFSVCILQLFFLLSLGSTECFLLSVMAYDRYLAICYPLSDTRPVELATFLISIIVVVASCVVTLVSYVYIISSILRIQSAHGRKKAFSTCSAHLSVVTIWYGSTMFLYVKPSAQNSLDLNKIVNTFNTVVTPLLNPFIYTLRNKEVKLALGRAFQKK